jgi:hypothetical protein
MKITREIYNSLIKETEIMNRVLFLNFYVSTKQVFGYRFLHIESLII